MISSTPPALTDRVAADALGRRWPMVVRYLRMSSLVLPAAVAVVSTVTLMAAIPAFPASMRGWVLPLHVVAVAAPPVLALIWLRGRGLWPPQRWAVGKRSAAMQFAVLAVEVGVLGWVGASDAATYWVVVGAGLLSVVGAMLAESPMVTIAALGTCVASALVRPAAVPGWTLWLPALAFAVPVAVVVLELRPGQTWPPRQWTSTNLTPIAVVTVLAVEVATMLRSPGAIAHVTVAAAGFVSLVAVRTLDSAAVTLVEDIVHLDQAESYDTVHLPPTRLGTPPGSLLLEQDALVWVQHIWQAVRTSRRTGRRDPLGGRLRVKHAGTHCLGEVRFDDIHAVWPVVRPPEEPPYIWLVPTDEPPVYTNSRETLVIQLKAPGSSHLRIPVRDAEVSAALVRRRMRWWAQQSNRNRPNRPESRYSR